MFDLKEFIVTNIINGVKNGTFTKEYANIMAVNYMLKNVLTEVNVAFINAQIEAWEVEKTMIPEPVEPGEIPVEDVMTYPVEEEPTEEDLEDSEEGAELEEETTEEPAEEETTEEIIEEEESVEPETVEDNNQNQEPDIS